MSDNEQKSLAEFPSLFPIKIMGEQHPEFREAILVAIRVHAPDLDETLVVERVSSKGNYTGFTITVNAQSQEQLDNIYRALTSHPRVKVVF